MSQDDKVFKRKLSLYAMNPESDMSDLRNQYIIIDLSGTMDKSLNIIDSMTE